MTEKSSVAPAATKNTADQPIIKLSNVSQHFPITGGLFKKNIGNIYAVNNVTLSVPTGHTLGVVGESGCGKSTLARTMVRLYEPTSGSIIIDGVDFSTLGTKELIKARRNIQMVFQDPYSSLNPRMSVGNILQEPLELHNIGTAQSRRQRAVELLSLVGLGEDAMLRYPHEFSGGQRQRICIARALALNPKILIADEAVSALDVSIQSQILNLMNDLKKKFNLTILFISHDLAVVKFIADRIAVMYLGHVVEMADSADLFSNPKHPYTRSLLASIPEPNPHLKGKLQVLSGDVPSPKNPPPGCPFNTRCPQAQPRCKQAMPPLLNTAAAGAGIHQVACILYENAPTVGGTSV